MRRSSAFRRSAVPAPAERDQLAGDIRPVHQSGRDRIDRVPPAVRREVGARQLEHTSVVVAARRARPRHRPSTAGCPRGVAGSRRRTSRRRARGSSRTISAPTAMTLTARQHRSRASRAAPRYTALTPMPSSTEVASTTSGTARAVLRSASPTVELVGERLEHGPERRRAVVRMGADRDHDSDEQESDEERAVPPAHEPGGQQRQRDERVAGEDDERTLRVVLGRFDPRAQPVLPVEEPVAEAAQYLVGCRRARDRFDRLGVAQHVEAVAALDRESRDPPQAT